MTLLELSISILSLSIQLLIGYKKFIIQLVGPFVLRQLSVNTVNPVNYAVSEAVCDAVSLGPGVGLGLLDTPVSPGLHILSCIFAFGDSYCHLAFGISYSTITMFTI